MSGAREHSILETLQLLIVSTTKRAGTCVTHLSEIEGLFCFLRTFFLQLTIGSLLSWIRENLLKERPELFLKDDSVYACVTYGIISNLSSK